MKKSFYFALALTAGLFASCSSDDLTAEAPQQQPGLEVDDAQPVPIQIGVANAGATASITRGTGTVGTSEGGTSKWLGQEFQLFMFNKGTLTPGSSDGTEAGVVFCDSTFTTNADGSGSTEMKVNGAAFQAYYPAAGSFDFWAYRLDDAKTGDPTGVATYAAATGWTENATEVLVPFVIDGTQDIMLGSVKEAALTADIATLAAVPAVQTAAAKEVPAVTASQFAESKIYSAYSARRGVNPTLSFQHLLTRLHFAVKAGDKKVSSSDVTYVLGGTAANSIPAAADGGFLGFRVDSIWVYSKSEGKLVAAYKTGSPYAAGGNKADTKIEWERADANAVAEDWADYTTLKPMYLKERSPKVNTPETGGWDTEAKFTIAADGTITYSGTIHTSTTDTRTANGTDKVYKTKDINSVTGKPTAYDGTLKEKAEAKLATYDTSGDGNVDADELAAATDLPFTSDPFNTYYVKTDINLGTDPEVTVPLQDLTGQQLIWAAKDELYWKLATKAEYTAADDADKEQVATTKKDFNTAIKTANMAIPTDAEYTAGKIRMVYIELGINAQYDEGEDFILGYVKPAKCTVDAGEAVARPIGEALLVAPSTDVDGYTIKIKYSRWRREGAKIVWASETQTSTIKQNANFVGGNSHLVTITINQDTTPAIEVGNEGYIEKNPFEIDD